MNLETVSTAKTGCIVPDIRHTVWNSHIAQTGAPGKSIRPNGDDAAGNYLSSAQSIGRFHKGSPAIAQQNTINVAMHHIAHIHTYICQPITTSESIRLHVGDARANKQPSPFVFNLDAVSGYHNLS
jgi:hypothetical protein